MSHPPEAGIGRRLALAVAITIRRGWYADGRGERLPVRRQTGGHIPQQAGLSARRRLVLGLVGQPRRDVPERGPAQRAGLRAGQGGAATVPGAARVLHHLDLRRTTSDSGGGGYRVVNGGTDCPETLAMVQILA